MVFKALKYRRESKLLKSLFPGSDRVPTPTCSYDPEAAYVGDGLDYLVRLVYTLIE